MIGISKLTKDDNGAVIIHENTDSQLLDSIPRVTRTATLDGGAVIEHKGFSEADRTFNIRGEIDENQLDILWELHKETTVYVSCKYGFFSGAIQRIRADNGELYLTIYIKEKLST